jgi:hypothetical protein
MGVKTMVLSLAVSGCAVAPAVMTGLGAGTIAVTETTGRSTTDHVVSTINGKDCKIVRYFDGKPVCQDPVPENSGLDGYLRLLQAK